MDLEQACDRYLDHLRVERNLSPHTLESYGRDLGSLRRYLLTVDVRHVEAVTESHLGHWMQSLAGCNLKASSQCRALSAVRGLFGFLVRERFVANDPCAEVRGPTRRRPLPVVVSQEEAARLVEMPTDEGPRGLRDRAALELLYGAGLRATELCSLRIDDVHLGLGMVRPKGKGGKERLVPLGQAALAALDAYLRGGRPALVKGHASAFVFIGNRGRALSRMGLFKLVRRYGLGAGIGRPLSPHKLRHAFATHLLQGGADLRSVQEMLGHASIATTEIYTHVGQDELRDTVDLFHPLGSACSPPRKP